MTSLGMRDFSKPPNMSKAKKGLKFEKLQHLPMFVFVNLLVRFGFREYKFLDPFKRKNSS
jgi:hypothetical protein